jgi:hypothetical protein
VLIELSKRIEDILGSNESGVNGGEDLIEDYIYNQSKDDREMIEGCTVKKIEDALVDGKYMANDIMWLPQTAGVERLAVSLARLH